MSYVCCDVALAIDHDRLKASRSDSTNRLLTPTQC